MLIKEGGRTLEESFTEEIPLYGEPEEISERFAKVIEELPRMYEIYDATCKTDALGYPRTTVLEFRRKYT